MTDAKDASTFGTLRAVIASDPYHQQFQPLLDHIDTLTRERDEARRDAARLDWLDTQMDGVHVEAGVAGGEYQMSWFATVYTFCDEFRAGTVREAIDKAMNHARTAALTPGGA